LLTGALYWNTTWARCGCTTDLPGFRWPSRRPCRTETFSGTGAQTAFTLASASGPAVNLEVFISGVRQVPAANYTVSGTTLTFVVAPPAGTDNIFVRYAQLLQEVSTAAFTLQEVTPTAGQTVITATSPYVPGSNNLAVYLNGLRQSPGDDFVETNSTTVTFTSALANTDKVLLVIGTTINESVGAQQVGYTPSGTGAVATNVQSKLREFVSVKDLNNVSSTNNRHGLILTGGSTGASQQSTATYINRCRFRENTAAGVVICQAYGVKFEDTVIESNVGNGVETYTQTSGEDYASPSPYTNLVTFFNSYWENNAKIIRTDGVVLINDFIFDRCSFTGKNAATDFDFVNTTGVKWTDCTMVSVGGFTLGATCTYFEYEGRQTDA
jgi:hypothetical protein